MKYGFIVLTLTMFLVSCSNDKPTPTPAQTGARQAGDATTGEQPATTDDDSVAAAGGATDDDTTDHATEDDAAAAGGPMAKVNLNTATREQFLALPEVTERMAHEFDEYRPYVSIRQFRREIGKYVDDEQVARYEQYVYVPIDMNEADAETLQQIPGLTAEMAATVIAMRPFDTADEFLAALTGKVDADAVEIARTYIAEE